MASRKQAKSASWHQNTITNQVKDRCLAIIAFLLEMGCVSYEEVYRVLDIENQKGFKEDEEALEVKFGGLKENFLNIVESIR